MLFQASIILPKELAKALFTKNMPLKSMKLSRNHLKMELSLPEQVSNNVSAKLK